MTLEVFKSCELLDIKHVTRKFVEVSRFSRAKQGQRNVQKKCVARVKLLFVITPTVSLPSPLSLHDFMFCFSKQ